MHACWQCCLSGCACSCVRKPDTCFTLDTRASCLLRADLASCNSFKRPFSTYTCHIKPTHRLTLVLKTQRCCMAMSEVVQLHTIYMFCNTCKSGRKNIAGKQQRITGRQCRNLMTAVVLAWMVRAMSKQELPSLKVFLAWVLSACPA